MTYNYACPHCDSLFTDDLDDYQDHDFYTCTCEDCGESFSVTVEVEIIVRTEKS